MKDTHFTQAEKAIKRNLSPNIIMSQIPINTTVPRQRIL